MEPQVREFEENKTLSPFWGWVALILFSIALMGFGMIAHMFIREPDRRQWDFGAGPIAPGETRYSTYEPPRGELREQIHPLPGALPLKRIPPDTGRHFRKECGP